MLLPSSPKIIFMFFFFFYSFNERLRCVSKARYETDFKIIEETNSSKDLRTRLQYNVK